MRTLALVCALLVLPSPIYAQALPIDRLTPALPTAGERQAADVASWGTALTVIALDSRASWDCADRRRCFALEGVRVGVTYGAALTIKALVQRLRPCAPDCGIDAPASSFYSAHTALAFEGLGGPRLALVLPLAIGTGGLRIAAGKHWLTDVLTGAAAGALTSRIR